MGKRRILVIAGSDSSGGAGLEADQKVIAAHLCYAMTATTALTAQNTLGVSDIHHIPSDFVVKQINACISDIGVDVVKIGMLASAKTVDAVAFALQRHGGPITVLDPVLISTSGAQLLPDEAVSKLLADLLPLTTILTPNIPEAKILLQNARLEAPEIESIDDMVTIARLLQSLGPRSVLVKGGHLPLTKDGHVSREDVDKHTVVDILYNGGGQGERTTLFETDYQASKNTHGTGCSLAYAVNPELLSPLLSSIVASGTEMTTAAIACGIALSNSSDPATDVADAVEMACQYIEAGICLSPELGHGNGPIGHFHSLSMQSPPPFQSSLRRSQYRGE